MGWYIRKGFKLGPLLRLNLSKSGLGLSFGAKGARIATGPRGMYVNMGRHGIYYRKRLHFGEEGPRDDASPGDHGNHSPFPVGGNGANGDGSPNLIDSSRDELIARLDGQGREISKARLFKLGSFLLWFMAFMTFVGVVTPQPSPWNAVLMFFVAVGEVIFGVLSWQKSTKIKEDASVSISYELDPDAKLKFDFIQTALKHLALANRVWVLKSARSSQDVKYTAGAGTIVDRRAATVGSLESQLVRTNVEVCGITDGSMKLFFLPDTLLVFNQGQHFTLEYAALQVSAKSDTFVEEEGVPSDSEIVGQTWKYVNKKGGPDKRFSNNKQIPLVVYGMLSFSSSNGFRLDLEVSSKSKAFEFAKTISTICGSQKFPPIEATLSNN